MNVLFVVIPALVLLMFGLGLELEKRNFTDLFRKPKAVFVGLFAQIVVLPLIAFSIAYFLKLNPLFAVGLVLIACCPGGSSSNALTMVARGDCALSVSLTTLSSLLSLITVPLIMGFAINIFLSEEKTIELPFLNTVMHTYIVIIFPVCAGMFFRTWRESLAVKINMLIRKLAIPLLILVITIFTVKKISLIMENLKELFMAVFLLLTFSMLFGKLLALVFRIKNERSVAIIIEIGIQNAAYAITIAVSPMLLNNEAMAVPAVIYAVMMNLFVFPYIGYVRLNSRKRELALLGSK